MRTIKIRICVAIDPETGAYTCAGWNFATGLDGDLVSLGDPADDRLIEQVGLEIDFIHPRAPQIAWVEAEIPVSTTVKGKVVS